MCYVRGVPPKYVACTGNYIINNGDDPNAVRCNLLKKHGKNCVPFLGRIYSA